MCLRKAGLIVLERELEYSSVFSWKLFTLKYLAGNYKEGIRKNFSLLIKATKGKEESFDLDGFPVGHSC